MTMTAPSFSQIKAKIAAIRQKDSKAARKPIGIHSQTRWTDETPQPDGENQIVITQCDSPLSFRMALREPAAENTTKVLITDLRDQDLGEDVLLRLAKRKLVQIDPWEIVRSLFDAHAVDPRLTQLPWIAEALLDWIPSQEFSPARGGFLDAETVWPLLLGHAIGLRDASPDLTSLLKWSLDEQATSRFRNSSSEFREACRVVSLLPKRFAADSVSQSQLVRDGRHHSRGGSAQRDCINASPRRGRRCQCRR